LTLTGEENRSGLEGHGISGRGKIQVSTFFNGAAFEPRRKE
jgi:hypothetical protein